MLIRISQLDFEQFINDYDDKAGMKVLSTGNSLVIFRKNAVMAVVADAKFFLSESMAEIYRRKLYASKNGQVESCNQIQH